MLGAIEATSHGARTVIAVESVQDIGTTKAAADLISAFGGEPVGRVVLAGGTAGKNGASTGRRRKPLLR